MEAIIEKTDLYHDYLAEHNPKGLLCFEKGYHDVQKLEIEKKIPVLDDLYDWFRCTDCNTITFKRK